MTPSAYAIFDGRGDVAARVGGLLGPPCDPGPHPDARAFLASLRRDRPAVALIAMPESGGDAALDDIAREARALHIPTLAILPAAADADRARRFDDWVVLGSLDSELVPRVGRWGRSASGFPAVDPHFLTLMAHDLRSPLNVLYLTIRAVSQGSPDPSPEFQEDMTFLQENARQIDKMLGLVGDLGRLVESEAAGPRLPASPCDPRRLLADFLEDRLSRPGVEAVPVRLEVADGTPAEVSIDQGRARLALQHAIGNAISTGGGTPVRLRSSGRPGGWIIEVILDRPPPAGVQPGPLRPGTFDRLLGIEADRKGLDLAIAAHIAESLGGSARLEIEPGRRSSIVFDWPATSPA